MSARSRMTMRAVYQSNLTTAKDDYGQPDVPSWQTQEKIPCYAWTRAKRVAIDADKTAIIEDFRAIVPRGTSITDENRFLNITDRQDVEIFAGPIRIQTIQVKLTHLELTLKTVDSGADVAL